LEFRRRNTTKEKRLAKAAAVIEQETPNPYMPFFKVVTIHPSKALN